MLPTYDEAVNTSIGMVMGKTAPTDSAKSLVSFITADVPPCLGQGAGSDPRCVVAVLSDTHPVSPSAIMGLK